MNVFTVVDIKYEKNMLPDLKNITIKEGEGMKQNV